MPSTNKTTNYGLNQWQLNEYLKREDLNSDNLIIDAELKNVNDKADGKIGKSLATAASQFLISSAVGQWVVKTIDEIKSLLGLGSAAYKNFDSVGGVAAFDTVSSHLSDYVRQPGYGVTVGSANTYALTLNPAPAAYVDGMGVVVKINAANTGAATINVNGQGAKAVVDGKGNALAAGKLRLNGTYSLKYNSTSGNFILQGSDSSGNATPADLLAGKTASTDTGDIVGTMPIVANNTPPLATAYWAPGQAGNPYPKVHFKSPIGYSDGNVWLSQDVPDLLPQNLVSGKNVLGVQGSIPVRTNADTGGSYPEAVNDSVYDRNIYLMPPAGYYDGNVWVHREMPGLLSANIRQGVTIGTGSGGKIVGSFAGKRWQTGTAYASVDGIFELTGLPFKPSKVILVHQGGSLIGIISSTSIGVQGANYSVIGHLSGSFVLKNYDVTTADGFRITDWAGTIGNWDYYAYE